jgi:Na+/H+ antiporter NhaD/arsenite permease-like protein
MNLAWLSVGALIVAIIVSCVSPLNVGVLSIVFAWIVGVYFGGLKLDEVLAGFPASLFLTLVGVTMLFAQAQLNGTLDKLAHRTTKLCRGNVGLLPVMFFVLTAALSSLGPGNIASAALVAPMAMAVAGRASVPAFLMAIMVGNGASAGSLSPFAPAGIIVNGIMTRIGLPGHAGRMYANNLMVHAVVAIVGYLVLGGWRLFRYTYTAGEEEAAQAVPLDTRNWVTLGVIATLIIAVVFFGVNVGMGAFAGAAILVCLGLADQKESIRRMPWGVIVMVCGVTVLIALLEKTEGLALFTSLIARFATAKTITGYIAFITGLISVYSSTSGVVLPAFLPTIPGLVQRLGGGDPLAIASSISVAGHLVDVSPLSTIGALCIAAIPAHEDPRALFNKLLVWGLSMTVVGATVCYLLF